MAKIGLLGRVESSHVYLESESGVESRELSREGRKEDRTNGGNPRRVGLVFWSFFFLFFLYYFLVFFLIFVLFFCTSSCWISNFLLFFSFSSVFFFFFPFFDLIFLFLLFLFFPKYPLSG